MTQETAFQMATSNIRYGPGVTREAGMDLADMGVTHVMVVADPQLANLAPGGIMCEQERNHCVRRGILTVARNHTGSSARYSAER